VEESVLSGSNIPNLASRPLNSADLQNFQDEYSQYCSRDATLEKILRVYLVVKETLFNRRLLYCKQLIPIADLLLRLVRHHRQQMSSQDVILCEAVKLFVVFVMEVVPYFSG